MYMLEHWFRTTSALMMAALAALSMSETNLVSESRYIHAQFFLPRSADAHLELVCEIVADTIEK